MAQDNMNIQIGGHKFQNTYVDYLHFKSIAIAFARWVINVMIKFKC